MIREMDDMETALQLDQLVLAELEASTDGFIDSAVAWLQGRADATTILERIRERVAVELPDLPTPKSAPDQPDETLADPGPPNDEPTHGQ